MSTSITKSTCPHGHVCRKIDIKNGIDEACVNYILMQGVHPTTGEAVNEYGCGPAWTTTFMVNQTKALEGIKAAIESMRNEMLAGQAALDKTLKLK